MTQPIIFATERLEVSPLDRKDPQTHREIMALFTDSVAQYLPPACQQLDSAEQVDAWLDTMEATGSVLVVRQKATTAGYLFVFPEPEATYRVGYVLGESFWGQGLASEAMSALIDKLLLQGAKRFIAGVEPANGASVNVLTKLGFVLGYSQQDVDYYQYRG
ncbi:GNAT family N-acetyltransferase [Photobacterium aquae]|uniref:GNAT family N-acetyltransferase n=1 Tax=Photobacterium aquae TaxID=1195763 RepID=UPI00069EF72B|nr:GNAT family N-acetyltransferase [Photobacterium aquae]